MKRYWNVSWSFEVIVEAETKAEAERAARTVIQNDPDMLTAGEIVDEDPLQITECDEDGEEL